MSLGLERVLKVGGFDEFDTVLIEQLMKISLEQWSFECAEELEWIQEVCQSFNKEQVVKAYEVLCSEVESLLGEYVIVNCTTRRAVLQWMELNEETRDFELEEFEEELVAFLREAQGRLFVRSGLSVLQGLITVIGEKLDELNSSTGVLPGRP